MIVLAAGTALSWSPPSAGMRAPTLQGGGDAQFSMMAREGFTYDHSMPSLEHGYLSTGVDGAWPYTLDYK